MTLPQFDIGHLVLAILVLAAVGWALTHKAQVKALDAQLRDAVKAKFDAEYALAKGKFDAEIAVLTRNQPPAAAPSSAVSPSPAVAAPAVQAAAPSAGSGTPPTDENQSFAAWIQANHPEAQDRMATLLMAAAAVSGGGLMTYPEVWAAISK